jgi:hypothetical protein
MNLYDSVKSGFDRPAATQLVVRDGPNVASVNIYKRKNPDGQVLLSVPELRHLLTHLLWRGWHGVEHLLHWSQWRRQHRFRAVICHYRKRGSPLPAFYLQL